MNSMRTEPEIHQPQHFMLGTMPPRRFGASIVLIERLSPDGLLDVIQKFKATMLLDHLKTAIAPYKHPRAVEFVDTLPRAETGKLQRFRPRGAP